MKTPIAFETQRLRLRQRRPSDRAAFAALDGDPRVMACFPSTLDRAASDAMADRCAALIARRGWGFWAAEEKAGGQFIGFVGLHVPSSELPFSPCVEIGWRLAFPWWGKGLATEAARLQRAPYGLRRGHLDPGQPGPGNRLRGHHGLRLADCPCRCFRFQPFLPRRQSLGLHLRTVALVLSSRPRLKRLHSGRAAALLHPGVRGSTLNTWWGGNDSASIEP